MHSGKWGSKAYLESLHRTYNVSLPRRDDSSFERALQYRRQEQEHYHKLQLENERLKLNLTQLSDSFDNLSTHSRTLLSYYDVNSKQQAIQANVRSTSAPPRNSSKSRRNDDERQLVQGSSSGSANEVPGEVLPTDHPSSGGQAIEHSDEGRELGKGDGDRGEETDTA